MVPKVFFSIANPGFDPDNISLLLAFLSGPKKPPYDGWGVAVWKTIKFDKDWSERTFGFSGKLAVSAERATSKDGQSFVEVDWWQTTNVYADEDNHLHWSTPTGHNTISVIAKNHTEVPQGIDFGCHNGGKFEVMLSFPQIAPDQHIEVPSLPHLRPFIRTETADGATLGPALADWDLLNMRPARFVHAFEITKLNDGSYGIKAAAAEV